MLYKHDMIMTDATRVEIIEFLIHHGTPRALIAPATNVELINTYHQMARRPTEEQRQAAVDLIARLTAPRRSHYRTELVTSVARLGHPVMLVGPAGCGKTTIGEHVAEILGLLFYITNTVADAHELLGFIDGYGRYHSTPFRRAFECGGLWVADEIDAWEAGALLTANSALANGYASFPDAQEPIRRHSDFRMVATANTFGNGADRIYVGRNELDAASLDRFATIDVDYDLDLERMFAGDQQRWLEHVWTMRKAIQQKRIRHVVSSRAISMGAAALAAGLSWRDVEAMYLFKGLSSKDKDKLE